MTNKHLNRPSLELIGLTGEPGSGPEPQAGSQLPRVLMVLKRSAGRGGMQQQARRVSLGLRARGVPVTVLSHARSRDKEPPNWADVPSFQYLVAANQWGFAAQLYRHFLSRRSDYDVIHIHGFGLETFAAIAARCWTGKPLVVKPSTAGRGTKLGVYARLAHWFPFLWRRLWSGVDRWISISNQIRSDLIEMGVDPSRIKDVPNGVDLAQYSPCTADERALLRQELGLCQSDVVICSVSRLSAHKRVDVLVRHFLRLAETHPEYHLWVMGKGELMGELQSLIQHHPAGKQVKLLGFLGPQKVSRLLQSADIFALISRWEGLSNALLEAMACGLAPLVTNVSGMADVVVPEERGLVVPLEDETALSAALERLCGDAVLRRRFGLAASEAVAAAYSLDATVDRLLVVYASCVAARPRSTALARNGGSLRRDGAAEITATEATGTEIQ